MKMEKILLTWQKQCQSNATDNIGEAPCRRFQAFGTGGKVLASRKRLQGN
jgi:hypothetical protein